VTRREQDLLSAASITTFRLNGQFLALAEELARPAGLTAAWWQVLGAVLGPPLPVAGIAREMGLTRQSVQRIADILVERGVAEYRDNPAHRRAKPWPARWPRCAPCPQRWTKSSRVCRPARSGQGR
jgi:MarR family